MQRVSSFLLLLLASGCVAGPDESAALQSGSLARSADGTELWAAHPDEGAVSRTDLSTGSTSTLRLSGEPGHVARGGTRLYVSLPANGSVAVLNVAGAAPVLLSEHKVGSEPAGLVVRRSDGHLFLALAGENRVVQLNPVDLTEVQGWDVPGFPSGLAIHPEGHSVYVSSTFGGRLSRIILATGVVETADIPVDEILSPAADGSGAAVALGERSPRLTSAPALTEEGDRIAVGLQRLDTMTSGESYITFDETEGPRVETSIAWAELSELGEIGPIELVDATLSPGGDAGDLFSYLGAVTWLPGNDWVAASMEASDVVGIYDLSDGAPMKAVQLPAPGGLSATEDALFIQGEFGATLVSATPPSASDPVDSLVWETAEPGLAPSLPELDATLVTGRRSFRTAVDPSVSLAGSGTSCSTCHTPAGTDGLTWALPDGFRQTPALHAGTLKTAPYQWDGEVHSIADEALATSVDRMGGADMSEAQAAAIAEWVGSRRTLAPPTRLDAEAVARGADVFQELGCDSCHSGKAGTDGALHEVAGVQMDTPALQGLAHTAPYLHGGSAADLEAVVDYAASGKMGAAFSISTAERSDLVEYLKSR